MIVRSVGELIHKPPLYSACGDATAAQVCRSLHAHHFGALTVLQCKKLVDIISERDVVTRVIVQERNLHLTAVREIMTPDPQIIEANDSLANVLEKLLIGHFRHLPVMCGDKVIGMISMRDIPTEYPFMYQRFREAQIAVAIGCTASDLPKASGRTLEVAAAARLSLRSCLLVIAADCT